LTIKFGVDLEKGTSMTNVTFISQPGVE